MNHIQLNRIRSGRRWGFFGGIRARGHKRTTGERIATLGIPALLTLPLERHLGLGGSVLVKVGDSVKGGQPLTQPGPGHNVPLFASTSGSVVSIGMHVLPHPSGFQGMCLTIKPDLRDEHVAHHGLERYQEHSPEELLELIRSRGVEGLGGAMFQTEAKLRGSRDSHLEHSIVIINGAECEPVATCDDRLMQEQAPSIVTGIEIIRHILRPDIIVMAIEKNKPQAIGAMEEALHARHNPAQLRVIPTIYPSGASHTLIRIVTGMEIPHDVHTSECGVVVINVGTVHAVKQAVRDGLPLTRRVVTVDGGSLGRRGNALVMLGTSVRYVMNAYRLNPERHQKIIMGGPLMGFTLPSIDVPVTKSTTCLYAPEEGETTPEAEERPCIRCGRCARACPSRLMPYQLYAYSRAGLHQETREHGIADCIDCGCCSYVCPSRIQLAAQFRREQALQRLLSEQEQLNALARERRAAKEQQLADEELVRQAKRRSAMQRIAAAKGEAAPPADTAEEQRRLREAQLRIRQRREQADRDKEARERRMAHLGPAKAHHGGAEEQPAAEHETPPGTAEAAGGQQEAAPAQAPSAPLREELRVLPASLKKDATDKHYTGYTGFKFDRDACQPNLTVVENPPRDPEQLARIIAEQRQSAQELRQQNSRRAFDGAEVPPVLPSNLRKHHHRSSSL